MLLLWHYVSNQPLTPGVIWMRNHHRLTNSRILPQHCFHFSRFDAVAAYLYLLVPAPQELHLACGVPPSYIPRAVEAFALDDNILFPRQSFASQVAARDPGATNINFAGHADRHYLPVFVIQPDFHIPERSSNEVMFQRAINVQAIVCTNNGAFSGTVENIYLRNWKYRFHLLEQIKCNQLTTNKHPLDIEEWVRLAMLFLIIDK